jgi:hypothetical protein
VEQMGPEQFDWLDHTVQFAGFAPSRKSNMYEYRNAINNRKEGLERRRNDLRKQFLDAKKAKNLREMNTVKKEIRAYNKANPDRELTNLMLKRSEKGKQKRQDQTKFGVHTHKKHESLRDEGRFARIDGW